MISAIHMPNSKVMCLWTNHWFIGSSYQFNAPFTPFPNSIPIQRRARVLTIKYVVDCG